MPLVALGRAHARVYESGFAARAERGNFPPCNALKTHEMRKRISIFSEPLPRPAERLAEEAARSAPLAIRVLDPARASTNAVGRLGRATTRVMGGRDREGNFPPRKALKTHKMGQESQPATSNPTGSLPSSGAGGSHASARHVPQPMLRRQSPSGARVMRCGIEMEVAPGELIDKLTILEIKRERIHDAQKRANVETEFAALQIGLRSGRSWLRPRCWRCAPNCARSMAASGRSRTKSATASSGRTSARRSSRSRARSIGPTTGAPSSNAKSTCCSDRG